MTWEPSLEQRIKSLALALGFDRVGIAPAAATPHSEFLREWVERGFAGGMEYIERRLEERIDPGRIFEGARSAVVVALAYDPEAGTSERSRDRPIARYAGGDDYHEVLEDRLRALAAAVEELAARPLRQRVYVDTGPVCERALAGRAGLGWIGKNTCLIDRELGSYLLLGVLLTEVSLTPDASEPDHCGSCTACLDACPTDAFESAYVLDATRCIAYTTIEDPGPIPIEVRAAHGEHLFGCDVCQEVCPWNTRRLRPALPDPLGLRERLAPREVWVAPEIRWILNLDEEAWWAATRRSAIRRSRRRGLQRNALVAAGNSGDPSLREAIESHALGDDPMLAEHARWALARLEQGMPATRGAKTQAAERLAEPDARSKAERS